jgi:hypothetical protein
MNKYVLYVVTARIGKYLWDVDEKGDGENFSFVRFEFSGCWIRGVEW